MNFDLVVAEQCSVCERVEKLLQSYTAQRDFINFEISVQNLSKYKTTIVPSLFINGKLFSYGDVDLKRLEKKINKINIKEIKILV